VKWSHQSERLSRGRSKSLSRNPNPARRKPSHMRAFRQLSSYTCSHVGQSNSQCQRLENARVRQLSLPEQSRLDSRAPRYVSRETRSDATPHRYSCGQCISIHYLPTRPRRFLQRLAPFTPDRQSKCLSATTSSLRTTSHIFDTRQHSAIAASPHAIPSATSSTARQAAKTKVSSVGRRSFYNFVLTSYE